MQNKSNKIDLKRFGKIIYDLRKKYDLVQDILANYIGVKRASYSGVERGIFGPGPSFILGIYKFYREKGEMITIDYLYGAESSPGMRLGEREREEMKLLKEEIDRKNTEIELLKVDLAEQKGLVKALVSKL